MAAAVVEFNSVKRGRERHLWDLVNGHKGSPLETNGTVCGPVANHLRNDGDDARPGQKRTLGKKKIEEQHLVNLTRHIKLQVADGESRWVKFIGNI